MLTRRERVMKALSHQEPDRPPIDFGGHRSSSIMAIAYNKLKKALGIESGGIYVYDMVQQLAVVEQPVLDLFDVDIIELGRGFGLNESDWHDWVLPDGTPCKIPYWVKPERQGKDWVIRHQDGTVISIMKESALYFEQTCWPLMEQPEKKIPHLEEYLPKVMWWSVSTPPLIQWDDEGLKALGQKAKEFYESTDRAIVGLFGGNLIELGEFLRGMENFLADLALDPKLVHRLLDKLVEIHLENLEKYLKAVGPYIQIILFGDDLGMQTGPQISPKMYREFFKPRHKILFETAKKLANVKVMLHSCGSIYELLPDLIDAGLDVVNPVQTTAKNMEPERLKREFGKDMVFWGGGCDTRSVLPYGTPEEIRAHVRERKRVFSPGGGWVFQQVHNIMADVPPENIIAMFEAAKE